MKVQQIYMSSLMQTDLAEMISLKDAHEKLPEFLSKRMLVV